MQIFLQNKQSCRSTLKNHHHFVMPSLTKFLRGKHVGEIKCKKKYTQCILSEGETDFHIFQLHISNFHSTYLYIVHIHYHQTWY